ncbi:MAG: uroporphyrinogen-III C-methyltransferase [Alphaproteobacteria bacterium]|nr:uroporphyrinogen-III C-methyltransferase [Alphaproteobacteria bacterium]
MFPAGEVWLVGAGPGDPGLLTLHAVNALAQADVVVYDALVDDRILALARPGAEHIYAGKRGGRPGPKQPDISARLVHLARAEKRVLRLKGGDPFVFGRGGEEALALVRNRIPFRVVPGITAGIGGLAYAGIPVTHRDINSAVTFITGHNSAGDVPDGIDWTAVANGAPVLVLYMALKHLPQIRDRLMAGGRPPDEPVAVVAQAATPDQSVLETTLDRCAEDAKRAGVQPPALVVVGDVVRLRAALDWLGALDGRALDPDPLDRLDKLRQPG